MNKPNDIQQDIWDAAWAAAVDYVRAADLAVQLRTDPNRLAESISKALLAERNRDADIAAVVLTTSTGASFQAAQSSMQIRGGKL